MSSTRSSEQAIQALREYREHFPDRRTAFTVTVEELDALLDAAAERDTYKRRATGLPDDEELAARAAHRRGLPVTLRKDDEALCPGCGEPSGFAASTILPGNSAWHAGCYSPVRSYVIPCPSCSHHHPPATFCGVIAKLTLCECRA